jgi:hypothetical protein
VCCCSGLTSCCGGNCGYCSECVGVAACQNELCSSCITGSVICTPVCTPTPGSGTDICSNTSTSCCITDVTCLPYAGQDANGNDIYQNPDGSLRYTDGSPATRADIAYNCGACIGTPCSPQTCGTTDQPPKAGTGTGGAGPQGGGSGGGSAKSAQGQPRTTVNCQASKLSQAMNKFGSTLATLFSGGTRVPVKSVVPGAAVQQITPGISSNSYLLVVLVVGGLLLWLAFSHTRPAEG